MKLKRWKLYSGFNKAMSFLFMSCFVFNMKTWFCFHELCYPYYQQTLQSNAFLLRVLLEHSCLVWIASGRPAASPFTFYGLKHYHVTSVPFKIYVRISFHKEYWIWNFRLAPSKRVHPRTCPLYTVCWSEMAVFCERAAWQ